MLDKEMMKALQADGEKLKQLTDKDHGPAEMPDPEKLRQLAAWFDVYDVKNGGSSNQVQRDLLRIARNIENQSS